MTEPKSKPEEVSAVLPEKVEYDTNGGCWLWGGQIRGGGYGVFVHKGVRVRAHRVSYRCFVGEIPRGVKVLHRCDVPSCVNPSHLFLGGNEENAYDRAVKGRSASRLTIDQVREIYAAEGAAPPIALRYGVSIPTVNHIRNGTRWSHITGSLRNDKRGARRSEASSEPEHEGRRSIPGASSTPR